MLETGIKLTTIIACLALVLDGGCRHAEEPPIDLTFAQAQCRRLARCEPEALRRFPGGDTAGCIAAMECRSSVPQQSTVQETRECAQVYEQADCSVSEYTLFIQCQALYTADSVEQPLSEGETCATRARPSCQPELVCWIADTDSASCGTCGQRLEPGDPCIDTGSSPGNPGGLGDLSMGCVNGSFCDRWETNTCVLYKNVGEPCDNEFACKSGICGSDGRCAAQPKLGESCERRSSQYCESGLYCHDGICETFPDEGEPCDRSCRFGQVCHSGVCRTLGCGPGQLSDLCSTDLDCDKGLVCSSGDVCVPEAGNNESCETTSCQDAYYCDVEKQVCLPKKANGEPCGEDHISTCLHACIAGTCATPKEPGEPCKSFDECASYRCDEGLCSDTDPPTVEELCG